MRNPPLPFARLPSQGTGAASAVVAGWCEAAGNASGEKGGKVGTSRRRKVQQKQRRVCVFFTLSLSGVEEACSSSSHCRRTEQVRCCCCLLCIALLSGDFFLFDGLFFLFAVATRLRFSSFFLSLHFLCIFGGEARTVEGCINRYQRRETRDKAASRRGKLLECIRHREQEAQELCPAGRHLPKLRSGPFLGAQHLVVRVVRVPPTQVRNRHRNDRSDDLRVRGGCHPRAHVPRRWQVRVRLHGELLHKRSLALAEDRLLDGHEHALLPDILAHQHHATDVEHRQQRQRTLVCILRRAHGVLHLCGRLLLPLEHENHLFELRAHALQLVPLQEALPSALRNLHEAL
eukprot:Rhum_TRINITY_DN12132_c0_g3::Rhum_TRINITY_DN12132_c0_g3_i1::g.49570::m.49570